MDQLPAEVIVLIVQYLDNNSIQHFKKVCQLFDKIATDLECMWKRSCIEGINNNYILEEMRQKLNPHTCEKTDWRDVYKHWNYLRHFHKYSFEVSHVQLFEIPSPYMTLHRNITSMQTTHGLVLVLAVQSGCFNVQQELYTVNSDLKYTMKRINDMEIEDWWNQVIMCNTCGAFKYFKPRLGYKELAKHLYLHVSDDGTCSFFKQMAAKSSPSPHYKLMEGKTPLTKSMTGLSVYETCLYNPSDTIKKSNGSGWINYSVGFPVSCIATYAHLIFLGTPQGQMTIYYNTDVDKPDFTKSVWTHQLCDSKIYAFDVMEEDNSTFTIFCCTQAAVYKIAFSKTNKL